jgi:hypothetical protein
MSAVKELANLLANPQTIVPKTKAKMVRSLFQQYTALSEQENQAKDAKAAVRDIIANLFEEGTEELVLDGKSLAKLSKETRTLLNTDLIKANFPEQKFPDFYVSSTSSVLRLTKAGRTVS